MIAWDLVADTTWMDEPDVWVRVVGGRTTYEGAYNSSTMTGVYLQRLVKGTLRETKRYVDPETKVEFVNEDGTPNDWRPKAPIWSEKRNEATMAFLSSSEPGRLTLPEGGYK